MFWTPDDILKIANLMNVQRGKIGDRQVLHPDILAAAMQENPDDRGLDAVHQAKPNKYNNSVWSRQIRGDFRRRRHRADLGAPDAWLRRHRGS